MSKNDNTLIVGKVLEHFKEVSSTNEIALRKLASGDAEDGMVISTEHQTAGRGQRGSQWESQRGENLLLSVILRPAFLKVTQQFQLTKMASLGVSRTVQSFGLPAQIKWPNDIMVEGKKLAGILIQNIIQAGKIEATVMGIGLNVNQSEFPKVPNATSMRRELGQKLDLITIRSRLLSALDKYYLLLKSTKKDLDEEYHSQLFRLGERSRFLTPNHSDFYGKIVGVNEEGKLMVSDDSGDLKTFEMKEIIYP